jgi:hypothetical protein
MLHPRLEIAFRAAQQLPPTEQIDLAERILYEVVPAIYQPVPERPQQRTGTHG